MASEVYSPTTSPNPKSSWCLIPTENLEKGRFVIKILEVLLSFVAFIMEEVVNSCISCTALYFFEFVSCSAFLFTLLLVFLLYTSLRNRVGITCWEKVDFLYTAIIAALFFIASCVFGANHGGLTVERGAVAFGFLASVTFIVDAILFLKSHGLPFKTDGKREPSNGVPPVPPPETEKLNQPPNGTE